MAKFQHKPTTTFGNYLVVISQNPTAYTGTRGLKVLLPARGGNSAKTFFFARLHIPQV